MISDEKNPAVLDEERLTEPHLTYEDLAYRWQMPVQTLRIYVMRGTLKPLRLGRHVRFPLHYILEIEAAGGFKPHDR